MSLDLGAVIGRVILEDVEFQRTYVRVSRQMGELGATASKSAAGTGVLDEALAKVAASGDAAAAAVGKATKATGEESVVAKRAALAEQQRAAALARVAEVMAPLAAATAKEQQAALRDLAATERLTVARKGAASAAGQQAASIARLAGAEAGAIGASERLAAAQRAQSVAAVGAVKANTGLLASLGGSGKMLAQLGLLIGGIEIAKKTIEFVMAGKDLTTALNSVQAAAQATDKEMVPVREQVIALGKDLTVPKATALDAAAAIDDLVRAGMTLPRAMAAARSALLLASASNTDMALTSRVLGDTLDEFRLPASAAAKTASMLGAAATSSAGGLDTVFEALKYAGTRARSANIPLEDLLASIVDLSKAGLQGTTIGTGLAMAISKLANPSGPGAKALKDLGIEAFDSSGKFKGLTYVVEQAFDAQKRFGTGSQRFLKDISEAFGARAANVIAAYAGKGVEGLDRFQHRLDTFDLQKAADNMNRGFGAAMSQITKQLTALGIDVYQKVEPALASAGMWLGTAIPHAISVLATILGPTVHMIGDGLVLAWHAVVAVLGPVASALGSVGHFLAQHSTLVRDVAMGVLLMWGAWKGVAIAQAAITAVNGGLTAMITRAQIAGDRMAMIGRGTATLGMQGFAVAAAAAGFAIYQLGMHISSWVEGGHSFISILADGKRAAGELTDALKATNGVLDQSVLKLAAQQIQSLGVASAASKIGLTLGDVTDAVTGNDKAFTDLLATWGNRKGSTDAILSLYQIRAAFRGGTKDAKDVAAAVKQVGDAHQHTSQQVTAAAKVLSLVVGTSGDLVWTTGKVADAADKATKALQGQTAASQALKTAEDILNGVNQSVETSTDSLSIALGNLRTGQSLATDKNGNFIRSLDQSTVAGATNRQMLVGVLDAAKAQAQAVADLAYKHKNDLGAALIAGNSQLAKNEAAIRSAARAAGLSAGDVDKLIKSIGILSKVNAKPKITPPDTAPAKSASQAVHDKWIADASAISRLRPTLDVNAGPALDAMIHASNIWNGLHDKSITLSVTTYGISRASSSGNVSPAGVPLKATGGPAPEGWYWTGEQGPELSHKRGSVVDIYSAAASRGIAPMIGTKVPGYATGTSAEISRALAMLFSVLQSATTPAPTTISGNLALFTTARTSAINDRVAAEQMGERYRMLAARAAAYQHTLDGIKDTSSKAYAAQKSLADAAAGAAQRTKDAWDALDQSATTAAQDAGQAATALVASVQARVDSLATTIGDFRSSISQGISGGVSLTSLWSDTGGDATAMQARANALLGQAKKFATDLTALAKLGVGPMELEQIVGLGPESGDALARQLIALGPVKLKALNASLDAIANLAGGTADTLAKGFYGGGAASLDSFIKGLEGRYPSLVKALMPIRDAIAKMFQFTPVVLHPTYSPTNAGRHYAAGGRNILGGMSLVGERGPEVVWLPPHSNVSPNGTALPIDWGPMVDRLERIEERLAGLPAATGQELASVGAGLYEAAGAANARASTRAYRKGWTP